MRKVLDYIDTHQMEFIITGVMLLALAYALVFNFVLLGV